ncbi:SRPBCC family protein [Streptomyces sp. NPDC002886]|uniref:SRPBCC family protein n=1 Tax=Streptomyces sp. NPDC002886 TaxID=3364667 RepID=UPI0036CF7129
MANRIPSAVKRSERAIYRAGSRCDGRRGRASGAKKGASTCAPTKAARRTPRACCARRVHFAAASAGPVQPYPPGSRAGTAAPVLFAAPGHHSAGVLRLLEQGNGIPMSDYDTSITVAVPAATLFSYLADVQNLPSYMPRLTSAKPHGGDKGHRHRAHRTTRRTGTGRQERGLDPRPRRR